MLTGSEFGIAAETETIAGGLDVYERRRPPLVLVDFHLADGVGTDLVRALRERGHAVPALLMTATEEPGLNELAREAGAQGSVLKTADAGELLKALRIIGRGGQSFDHRHPRRPAGQAPLSPREREVLRLVAAGETNRAIARQLEVSPETVKTLVTRTFHKLGVSKRAEAVTQAHRLGLL